MQQARVDSSTMRCGPDSRSPICRGAEPACWRPRRSTSASAADVAGLGKDPLLAAASQLAGAGGSSLRRGIKASAADRSQQQAVPRYVQGERRNQSQGHLDTSLLFLLFNGKLKRRAADTSSPIFRRGKSRPNRVLSTSSRSASDPLCIVAYISKRDQLASA